MSEQNEPHYVYLISPPELALEAFALQLEEALAAGKSLCTMSQGMSEDSSPSPSGASEASDSQNGKEVRPEGRTSHELAKPRLTARAEGAQGAVENLIGAFQLRLKQGGQASMVAADDTTIRRAVEVLLPICQKYSVAFILNDNPTLAAELGCGGVHVGQEDLEKTPVAMCREMMGEEAIIGVSCHASKHLAMDAAAGGADYVAFGAFHATKSKPMEKLEKYGTPGLELLEWWSSYTQIPCVAIGGMTPQNCAPMVAAGADFIAALSYVWEHPEGVGAAVREFASIIR